MIITARVRAGDQPVTDARITVELARPGISLGTFLATNGKGYQPPSPAGPDPAHPKLAMLQQLLRQQDMTELPIIRPPSIFVDGTNELFDDGAHNDGAMKDGDYANVYDNLDKEGTYTWRFFVEGRLPDGSSFNRLITISKWVDVRVNPLLSSVVVNYNLPAPSGLQAAQIVILPVAPHKEYLGPFRADELRFRATAGAFTGEAELGSVSDGVVFRQADGEATVSHYDGRYSRVLVYRPGEAPVVTVTVQGQSFTPIVVAPSSSGGLAPLALSLWEWFQRLFCR